jgi:hypothetical protein
MPIEIKELIVEISVSGEKEKGFAETTEKVGKETVKDYIEQVLTIIDNRKER